MVSSARGRHFGGGGHLLALLVGAVTPARSAVLGGDQCQTGKPEQRPEMAVATRRQAGALKSAACSTRSQILTPLGQHNRPSPELTTRTHNRVTPFEDTGPLLELLRTRRGRSSMVELQPSKLVVRVQFPSPARIK